METSFAVRLLRFSSLRWFGVVGLAVTMAFTAGCVKGEVSLSSSGKTLDGPKFQGITSIILPAHDGTTLLVAEGTCDARMLTLEVSFDNGSMWAPMSGFNSSDASCNDLNFKFEFTLAQAGISTGVDSQTPVLVRGMTRFGPSQVSNILVDFVSGDPQVAWATPNYTTNENSGSAAVTVSLSRAAASDVTVNYVVSGSATYGNDHSLSTTGSINIPAGQTTGTLSFNIYDNNSYEVPESLIIQLVSVSGPAVLSASSVFTMTINDNDAAPVISIADLSLPEGSWGGTRPATLTLTLNNFSDMPTIVDYATLYDTAAPGGVDFIDREGTLTIPAGSTSETLVFDIIEDSLHEDDETFSVVLSNPINSFLGDDTAIVTIQDDDTPPVVNFVSSSSSVTESVGEVQLVAELDTQSGKDTTIPFSISTTPISLNPWHDAVASSIIIPAGSTQGTYTFNVIDDSLVDPVKTVTFNMATPVGATTGPVGSHTVTIAEDDSEPALSVNDVVSNEGTITPNNAVFEVRLDKAYSRIVTFDYDTANGSATAGADYVRTQGSGTIAVGQTSTSVSVPIIMDSIPEIHKTFKLNLSNPTNATTGASQGTATIIDDDPVVVTGVTSSKLNNLYGVGSTIDVKVVFSSTVTVTGTPRIQLDVGGATAYATNAGAGNGTSTLTFNYVVGSEHYSSDLEYSSRNALEKNGGDIVAFGRSADLQLPAIGAGDSLGARNIQVDGAAPNPPTNILIGEAPKDLSLSPQIRWQPVTDIGPAGIAGYEVQVTGAVSSSILTLSSGEQLSGLSLSDGSSYSIQIRSKDKKGNVSEFVPADMNWIAESGPVNTWTDIADEGTPRHGHTAVWTGSQMIIWGGVNNGTYYNAGFVYDPTAGSWQAPTGAPSINGRYLHSAVWTGSEMIVWGGAGTATYGDGAAYNPATGIWRPLLLSNAPEARYDHTAVWTGSKMIVWGGKAGSSALNTGAMYDPVSDQWSNINSGSLVPRSYHTAVWTGSKMIVWGGYGGTTPGSYTVRDDGSAYDPITNSWSALTSTNAPPSRDSHTAVWTGSNGGKMIIWGGKSGSTALNTGAIYDPTALQWTTINPTGAPTARYSHTAVWAGNKMIVWGGNNAGTLLQDGGILTNTTWDSTKPGALATGRQKHSAIWTGSKMFIWGGTGTGNADLKSGAYYEP